jgi:DNA-binding transcriptional LysR family regulator
MGALSPKRWLRFNYVYQMLQVGLAGQGLLLARLPMMSESVLRGDLVELFPGRSEMWSEPPLAYWMEINRHSALRPEVKALSEWLVRAARESSGLIEARFPGSAAQA